MRGSVKGWLISAVVSSAAAWRAAVCAEYGKVELVRDRWGVPHVFAETDAGAMYGLGYATAEDRGLQMHYNLRVIQGRLAELVGDVKKTRGKETAVASDRKMRTFGFHRAARQVVKQLDAETRSLLDAYAHGVNDWFAENRHRWHPLFDKLGWEPEPWTAADCILSWWHLAQFFATDGTRDWLHYRNLTEAGRGRLRAPGRGETRAARRGPWWPRVPGSVQPLPPDDSAAVVGREDVSDEWVEKTRNFLLEHGYRLGQPASPNRIPDGPKFSHGWVAGGSLTGSGAVLVSMPQTPVTNPPLLYEFHIAGKTFNARGAGVPGSPVILIGFNRHVAWGMTALGADQADLFRLKTDADHPGRYFFDGQWLEIRHLREEIKVKGGRSQWIDIQLTRFGPVVNEFAFARPGDPPLALKRIPICETDRETIQGAMAMMRSRDVKEFFQALEGWRFPTANVLFADSAGNIGYSTAGALPLRSPHALDGGAAAHDGSASKYDWQGIIPHDLLPHVINPPEGYLFSGNHRPVGSFYPIPLGIRTGSMGDTVRSWRLRQLWEGQRKVTAEQVRAMFTDAVNPARYAIVRIGYHLRDVLKRDLSEDARRALEHLDPWYARGGPSRLDVPGAELAMEIDTLFRIVNTELAGVYGGGESGLTRFLKTVIGRLEEQPQADISPAEQRFVDEALAGAWRRCRAKYGGDPKRWNQQARRQVTERRLGYCESLDGFPSLAREYDIHCPPLVCVDGGTIFSQAAQAYVQWVPLADVDRAQSLLPPGPSERPDSAARLVNMENWVHGRLNPAPLSVEAVRRIGTSSCQLWPK